MWNKLTTRASKQQVNIINIVLLVAQHFNIALKKAVLAEALPGASSVAVPLQVRRVRVKMFNQLKD